MHQASQLGPSKCFFDRFSFYQSFLAFVCNLKHEKVASAYLSGRCTSRLEVKSILQRQEVDVQTDHASSERVKKT